MEHLIEVHHVTRILFMAGPEHNTDADERKAAYLEMMEKYHLPVVSMRSEKNTTPILSLFCIALNAMVAAISYSTSL